MGNFVLRKSSFDAILERSGTGISIAKFLRAILFTLIDILLFFPVLLAEFSIQMAYGDIKPYSSWKDVHYGFSNVVVLTKSMLDNPAGYRCVVLANISAWILCSSTLIFLAMFGFNVDAREQYSGVISWIKDKFKNCTRKVDVRYVLHFIQVANGSNKKEPGVSEVRDLEINLVREENKFEAPNQSDGETFTVLSLSSTLSDENIKDKNLLSSPSG